MDAGQRLAVGLAACAIVAQKQQRAVNVVAGDWAAAASESVGQALVRPNEVRSIGAFIGRMVERVEAALKSMQEREDAARNRWEVEQEEMRDRSLDGVYGEVSQSYSENAKAARFLGPREQDLLDKWDNALSERPDFEGTVERVLDPPSSGPSIGRKQAMEIERDAGLPIDKSIGDPGAQRHRFSAVHEMIEERGIAAYERKMKAEQRDGPGLELGF
jgi:hypothetical protein